MAQAFLLPQGLRLPVFSFGDWTSYPELNLALPAKLMLVLIPLQCCLTRFQEVFSWNAVGHS